ncbi:RNA polymerase sigma-70 factor, ECF subfamily [Quadrisphaera granulorum]|uniref:RNA polymerase sigma-70 factor (ECF subfamily) n=1 Tax=Quadrisphaera granulorum TaxID=317664 RepID=A0A315ZRZ3_9ACTN|nr:sigma-70 family RNA polymerase sigma factor [Quadrisphaera granulorum]PWJ48316.1 RNA polymerase sigma-70 factor (ECF subfamily) [Quadrisphaera granulorum]SZE98477.1 RNA polymerase sigma-70 factor, ECF subfamily [Quadrisphaera granulorum]
MGGANDERFAVLFRSTYEDLLRFTERRIHPLAAEDVVAEVFVVAWRRLAHVPTEHDQARAWLFGVAHRLLASQRRTDARRDALTSRIGQVLPPEGQLADGSEHVVSQIDLARAWSLLSPADQEALTLTALDDLSNTHAAQVLGISTTAFSVRLMRARRRLRVHLNSPARRARLRPSNTTTPGGLR